MLVIMCCLLIAAGQSPYQPLTYIPEAVYPANVYNTQADSFTFGRVTVKMANIKGRERQTVSFWCRSTLAVTFNSDTVFSRFYPDVEALGGYSGIYSEAKQLGKYLFISKYGDYNGRTIVVDSLGGVIDIPGGITYYTPMLDWIVAEQNTDIGGLSVYNIASAKMVFDSERHNIDTCYTCERYITDVVYDEKHLFIVYMNDDENNGLSEKGLYCLRFEHETQQVSIVRVPVEYIDGLPKINSMNTPNERCFCCAPLIHN